MQCVQQLEQNAELHPSASALHSTLSLSSHELTARPAEAARAAQQGVSAAAADACGEGGNGSDDEMKGMRAEIEKLRVEKAEAQRQVERLQAQALGLG